MKENPIVVVCCCCCLYLIDRKA